MHASKSRAVRALLVAVACCASAAHAAAAAQAASRARVAAEPRAASPATATLPESMFPAISWRLVGPHRGGWATMAVGVPGAPETFYFGAAGGGVWKTVDAGRTWRPITDGQPIAAVGALAVAPSDPNVLYVGTGHPEPRYDIIAGTGVYRSTDAGRTWAPAGLAGTRHIGDLLVDPRDANTVLVAAQGAAFGPGTERGVYRSADGGRSWSRTLYVDEQTGAVDLALDPANPDVVYAATWTARVWPWLSYFTPVQGGGSAIWRSSDGGRSWSKLGGEGWPAGDLGRIGLAVAHKAGATRIYASVGGEGDDAKFGLWRSDDDGAHWAKVNDIGWNTTWYMSRLTVAPDDPDTVYTVGQSLHVSHDAGRTFATWRGAPGGDDFHYLWIDPRSPQRMIASADQGSIVTLNGGASWSEWYNQPTGQFYYLATDDRFPYRIYSGQQDSGTVRIASRSDYGSISFRDWQPIGGDERDYDVPDPDSPHHVYATGLGGRVARYDERTGESQNVAPWPVAGYGRRPTDYRYHYNWFTPLAVSRATPKGSPHSVYVGSQLLFRTRDHGQTWDAISPDLSGRREGAQGCDGSPTPAQAYACGYGVINTIAPSPHTDDEIWAGTDDGRVWLTRDAGAHWRDVTPPGVPTWAKIASVDLSQLAAGTAYVAVDNHRQDDFTPHAWRTSDYGATWTSIAAGLPADRFVAVVRADPVRAGLLYAGTDLGVQFSLDDGAHWQSLQRNLPPAWVHDLLIKDRDLIAATNGRALWVLDDVTPLRQVQAQASAERARLYRPAPAWRLRANQNHDTPLPPETALGRNPPTGAVLDYWLAVPARKPVVLEVRDAAGTLVRRWSSDAPARAVDPERYFTDDWVQPDARVESTAGPHRMVWDLRGPRPKAVEYRYGLNGAYTDGVPVLPDGALVLPGEYRVALIVDGERHEVPLTVAADPRVTVPASDLAEAAVLGARVARDLDRAWRGYAELQAVRAQLAARRAQAQGRAELLAALDTWTATVAPLVGGGGERSLSFAAQGGVLADLATDLDDADRAPTRAQREVAAAATERLDAAGRGWDSAKGEGLAALNRSLRAAKLAPVRVPDAAHLGSPAAPESVDLP